MRRWLGRGSPSVAIGSYGSPWLRRHLRLSGTQLARHKHLIGVTGQGKSKLMAAIMQQLILQGVGVALIDPQADLALDLMASLQSAGFFARPDARTRLLYLDFGRADRFLPFNILRQPRFSAVAIAQQLVDVCERAWSHLAEGRAPQFENILLAAAVTLVENGLSLTRLEELLTNRPYRETLLSRLSDPRVPQFFHERFDRWGRDQPLMLESTLNKVFLLTFSPALRYTLGQPECALDFRALMDGGVSVICNLAGLPEADQRFLGSLLTVGFEYAAQSRADIPERERRPYHLFLDEFHLFCAQNEKSLDRVLSLARKYALTLTLAHQTWSQTSERLQGALQNTLHIAFRLGPRDAQLTAPYFGFFDPYELKHEVQNEAASERTHPVYFSVQESYERWSTSLKTLPARHAYVAVENTTRRIRTLDFEAASRDGKLQQLLASYQHTLLTHKSEIAASLDVTTRPEEHVVFRRV